MNTEELETTNIYGTPPIISDNPIDSMTRNAGASRSCMSGGIIPCGNIYGSNTSGMTNSPTMFTKHAKQPKALFQSPQLQTRKQLEPSTPTLVDPASKDDPFGHETETTERTLEDLSFSFSRDDDLHIYNDSITTIETFDAMDRITKPKRYSDNTMHAFAAMAPMGDFIEEEEFILVSDEEDNVEKPTKPRSKKKSKKSSSKSLNKPRSKKKSKTTTEGKSPGKPRSKKKLKKSSAHKEEATTATDAVDKSKSTRPNSLSPKKPRSHKKLKKSASHDEEKDSTDRTIEESFSAFDDDIPEAAIQPASTTKRKPRPSWKRTTDANTVFKVTWKDQVEVIDPVVKKKRTHKIWTPKPSGPLQKLLHLQIRTAKLPRKEQPTPKFPTKPTTTTKNLKTEPLCPFEQMGSVEFLNEEVGKAREAQRIVPKNTMATTDKPSWKSAAINEYYNELDSIEFALPTSVNIKAKKIDKQKKKPKGGPIVRLLHRQIRTNKKKKTKWVQKAEFLKALSKYEQVESVELVNSVEFLQ